MPIRTKIQNAFLYLSNLLLLIPLLLHGYLGLSSRYLADDFCTAGQFLARGFFSSLEYWYLNWSGRFAFYFFMNLTHIFGDGITPYFTALTLLVWWLALYSLSHQAIHAHLPSSSTLQSALLASLVLFAVLNGTPDLYQSLYWQTGAVTYVFPLILFTFFAAWLFSQRASDPADRPGWRGLGLSAGITFVAGGFSETYAAMQVAAVLILLLLVIVFGRGVARSYRIAALSSALAGALLALILMVTAPGNAVRMSYMPDRLSFPALAFWSARHAAAFSVKSLLMAPLSSLSALLVPGLLSLVYFEFPGDNQAVASRQRSRAVLYLVGIPFFAYLLIVAVIAPSVYATAAYPAERALVTAQFILICALSAWGLLCGKFLRQSALRSPIYSVLSGIAVVLLLVFSAILTSSKTLSQLPEAQAFARQWDERDLDIHQQIAAGSLEVQAASLPHISPGLAELSKDPNDWLNQCLALSYGVHQVMAK